MNTLEKKPKYIKWWNDLSIPARQSKCIMYFNHSKVHMLNWNEIEKIYFKETIE